VAKLLKFIIAELVCFGAAALGVVFTVSAIPTWYSTLNKPFFSPPNWLFGPAWTILYFLMGAALYRVWTKGFKSKKVRDGIKLFAVQLILNAIWSPVFFGAKELMLSLIIIIFMWIFILKTIIAFAKIDKISSYLLYPYLAWVSFATVLNFSVWFLNR
jgi:tryptophan-rich sensory protein